MSDARSDSHRIAPDDRYQRRRRRLRIGAVAAAVALVAAAGLYLLIHTPARLTDERDAFGADLAGVMGRIHTENAEVLAKHPQEYVTIVVLLPLSGDVVGTGMGRPTIRHALQGSHLAQAWRNKRQSAAPYIRLLVGDTGPGAWEATVEDLRARVTDDHVVAVTGLGASTEDTRSVIERLSRDRIAMVAAVLTSDELQRRPGLARVAPLNSDQAEAAVHFAQGLRRGFKPVVVMDTNSGNSYSRTLSESFDRALTRLMGPADGERRGEPLAFDSSSNSAGTVLHGDAASICRSDADTVFYAGRADNLPDLLKGLSQSSECVKRGIDVIGGDDTSEMSRPVKEAIWEESGGRISLYFTSLAHSANITDARSTVLPAVKAMFGKGDAKAYGRMFPDESLDDGQAIMHHDAMYVAIEAIDRYAGADLASIGPREVGTMLTSGTLEVDGAGGAISIDHDGNPHTEEIPVLQLSAYGNPTFRGWSSPDPKAK
jgi:hypothetical protein